VRFQSEGRQQKGKSLFAPPAAAPAARRAPQARGGSGGGRRAGAGVLRGAQNRGASERAGAPRRAGGRGGRRDGRPRRPRPGRCVEPLALKREDPETGAGRRRRASGAAACKGRPQCGCARPGARRAAGRGRAWGMQPGRAARSVVQCTVRGARQPAGGAGAPRAPKTVVRSRGIQHGAGGQVDGEPRPAAGAARARGPAPRRAPGPGCRAGEGRGPWPRGGRGAAEGAGAAPALRCWG
jgi:hypothetical protein